MEQVPGVTYCAFDAARPGPYQQYIPPHIAARARRNPERFAALGAAWRRYALGTAVFSLNKERPDEAALESLFVDPQARGRGVGSGLLRRAADAAHVRGAASLRLSYALAEPESRAMDRMARKLGGEPVSVSRVYTLDFSKLHDSPLFGRALSYRFRTPSNVKRFRDLERTRGDILLDDDDFMDDFVGPDRLNLMDPSLSLAWVENGEILSYLLTSCIEMGSYAALLAWSSPAAPWYAFVLLMASCANLCYYHGGGDFLYYLDALSDETEKIVRAFAKNAYTCMDSRQAVLPLPCGEQSPVD